MTQDRMDQLRQRSGFILAPLAFAGVYFSTAGVLADDGRRLSAILAAVVVLWVTEAIPLAVTALLGAALCIVLGVASAQAVLAPFADPIIFLFLGSFMLVRAMLVHELDRRIALRFLSIPWIAGSPLRLMAAMGLITATLSMWVSNTATTAMMLPIALGVLKTLSDLNTPPGAAPRTIDVRQWRYATGLLLMVAYAASAGGTGTPIGSPPNLIGIGLLRRLADVDIGFFDWMALGIPLFAAMYLALTAVLYWLHPAGQVIKGDTGALVSLLREQHKALGPLKRGELNTMIAFFTAVTLWLAPGVVSIVLGQEHPFAAALRARLPEAAVALLVVGLLFILPVRLRDWEFTLNWKQAAEIDWGTILLFGGGLSLGGLMFTTGVAEAIGRGILSMTGAASLWGLTAVAIATGTILTNVASNTAAANMLVPVMIALAQAAGINPVPPALGVCFGANFAFILPVATPPNAIVYGSGLVPISKMIRAGIIFNIYGFCVVFLILRIVTPMLGLV